MARDLEIRKVLPRDLTGLSSLYNALYSVRLDRDFWYWKYFRNPHGEHMMYVALDGEKIVGEIGSIPVRVKCGKETFYAAHTCDIAILPKYQKEGTFFRLYGEAIKENVSRNILFVYGISIPKTFQISTTLLDFHPVCPIQRWVFILDPAPYIARKWPFPILVQIAGHLGQFFIRSRLRKHYRNPAGKVAEVFQFDERFDRFWEERKNDSEIMVVRDSDYLNWRYCSHPTGRYKTLTYVSEERLRGFLVLTTAVDEIRRGIIVDILTDPSDRTVLDFLLSAAMDFFMSQKVDSIMVWLPEKFSGVRDMKKWGFVRRDTPYHLIVRLVDRHVHGVDSAYLEQPGNWHFTIGDSDHY